MDILLTITMLMAYLCTLLSFTLAVYFLAHRRHPLGLSMVFMLFAEAIGMAVLSTFATFEFLGTLTRLDPEYASYVRWAAISITALSSIHLTCRVRKIIKL